MTEQTQTPNLPAERQQPPLQAGGAVVALVPQTLDEAYRLANALSRSGLTPNNIKTPEAVMIVLLGGAELGFAPFQSLQSFGVINNKLCIYGDAIPALLWSKGFDIEEAFEGEEPGYPDTMKAVCTVTRPNGKKVTRMFSVADAKEAQLWTKQGPWQTSRKRMLQMRARAFTARDAAADVLRGLPLYEEVQDHTPIPDEAQNGTGLVARLQARAQPAEVDPDGFNVRKVTDETQAAKPERARGRRKAAEQPPASDAPTDAEFEERPPATPAEAAAAALEGDDLPGDLSSSAFIDPDTGISYPTMEARLTAEAAKRPTETASAPAADAPPASSGSATDASSDTQAATSGLPAPEPQSSDGATPEDVMEGVASPGEAYFLVGDAWDEHGQRPIYKDGVRFGVAGRQVLESGFALIFAQHAPRQGADTPEEQPHEEPKPANAAGDAIEAFRDKCRAATSWAAIRQALSTLRKTPEFTALPDEFQSAERVMAFQCAEALRAAGKDEVGVDLDPAYFVLWLDTEPSGDAVQQAFLRLIRQATYRQLGDAMKNEIVRRKTAYVEAHS